jgi:hypothetical protein
MLHLFACEKTSFHFPSPFENTSLIFSSCIFPYRRVAVWQMHEHNSRTVFPSFIRPEEEENKRAKDHCDGKMHLGHTYARATRIL